MVPPAASTSSALLNILGYPSEQYTYYVTYANYNETQSVTVLEVRGIDLIINWPCAGIHSVIIFTLMILVFAKNSQFSPISKIIIAAIGTTGTFLANAARISYRDSLYPNGARGHPPFSRLLRRIVLHGVVHVLHFDGYIRKFNEEKNQPKSCTRDGQDPITQKAIAQNETSNQNRIICLQTFFAWDFSLSVFSKGSTKPTS